MSKFKPREILLTSEAVDDEPQEFNSFDEAYAHLMSSLEPGGWIDLHEEDCALAADVNPGDCDCTPTRMVKGPAA